MLPFARPQPFVRVSDIRKTFIVPASGWLGFLRKPSQVDVLRGVSFEIAQGEIFGLLGENGAGKTTTLHVLAALVSPDSGSVTIGGLDACARPAQTRHLVGLCTGADRSFYYRLTLAENLQFFGSLTGLHGSALQKKIDEVLDLVDLRQFAGRTYGRCSSGMRQRATIARSLIAEPPLVLLDEPTRTLDPVHTRAVRQLVKERLVGKLGKTVVLATNSLEEAWELCDRIAVIKDGRVETIRRPNQRERPGVEELFGSLAACDA